MKLKSLLVAAGLLLVAASAEAVRPEPVEARVQYLNFFDVPLFPFCFSECTAFFPDGDSCCTANPE